MATRAQQHQLYVLTVGRMLPTVYCTEKKHIHIFPHRIYYYFFNLPAATNTYYSVLMLFFNYSRSERWKASCFHLRKTEHLQLKHTGYSSVSMAIPTLLVSLYLMEKSLKMQWTQTNAFKGNWHGFPVSFSFLTCFFCCSCSCFSKVTPSSLTYFSSCSVVHYSQNLSRGKVTVIGMPASWF